MRTSGRRTRQAGGLEPGRAAELTELVKYARGSIVSRTLLEGKQGTFTLFAFDRGQGLSEHSAPYDAYVIGLDGAAEVTIGGKAVQIRPGQIVLMPADVPHAVRATERFKMLLVMIRA